MSRAADRRWVGLGLLSLALLLAGPRAQAQAPVSNPNAVAPQAQAAQPADQVSPPNYKIGVGDVLDVSVFGMPEMHRLLAVGGDGRLTLPYLSRAIPAQGRTAAVVQTEVRSEIQADQLIVDPQVSVEVAQVRSHPVSVAGAVKNPTVIQVNRPLTVADALAMAGGVDPTEAGSVVSLTRIGDDGKPTTRQLELVTVFSPQQPGDNPSIQGGDAIRVLPRGQVFVEGAVTDPGQFPIPASDQLTVTKALALAKGLKPAADQDRAVLIHTLAVGTGNSQPLLLSDILAQKAPDPVLHSGDIVYIPTNGTKRAAIYVLQGAATSIFVGLGYLLMR